MGKKKLISMTVNVESNLLDKVHEILNDAGWELLGIGQPYYDKNKIMKQKMWFQTEIGANNIL